jgi:hypothetical protein
MVNAMAATTRVAGKPVPICERHLALSYRILLKHGGVVYPDPDFTLGAEWVEPLRRMAAVDGLPTTVGSLWFDDGQRWDVVAICRPDGSRYDLMDQSSAAVAIADDLGAQVEADWGATVRRARERAGLPSR